MVLCRPCHNRCHHEVGWARENGYIIYDYK
jgi:hypothetical protein